MFRYIFIITLVLFTFSLEAQHSKIFNKDFDIEAYDSVEFDLYGEVEYELWEADYILVETKVKVWDTPKRLFTNLVSGGRYLNELKFESMTARIASVPVKRDKLSVRESVVSTVYYPKSFHLADSKILRQEAAVTSKNEEEDKEEDKP